MRDIGRNIRLQRIRKNITQDALAEKLFVTRQTVSNYETGRSRPDVEMLASIAEALDTDVNTLIYGEKKNSDFSAEFNKLLPAAIITGLLGIIYLAFMPAARKLISNYFIAGPSIFLSYILLPAFYVLLSWTLMSIVGMLTKAKPLKYGWTKAACLAVYILLLLYFSIILPTVYHGFKSILVHNYVDSIRGDLLLYFQSYSSGFSLAPQWLNLLQSEVWFFISNRTYTFLFFGLLLWLFDFPRKRERNYIPLIICLGLSLIIYFSANEDFTIEVYDPGRLDSVPYGIEVIQKDLP